MKPNIHLHFHNKCKGFSPLLWIGSLFTRKLKFPRTHPFLGILGLRLLPLCLIGAAAFSAEQTFSQNQLQSVNISESLKSVLENLKCAQAKGAEANVKASGLERGARESVARLGNLISSSEAHHREFIDLLDSQIQALRTRLEAATRNAPLIEAARKSLEEIQTSTRTTITEVPPELGAGEAETSDPHAIWDFEMRDQDALTAACDFYRVASKMSVDPAAVQIVIKRVTEWASKNRSAIVLGETQLRKLEAALQEETAAKSPTINVHTNSRLVFSDQARVCSPNVQMTAPLSSTVIVYRQPYWTAPVVTFYPASQGVYCYCPPSQCTYWASYRASFAGGSSYAYWQQRPQNQVIFSSQPVWHGPRQHRR